MSPLLLLAVAVAGGFGAGLRYLVDAVVTTLVRRYARNRFPWGILVVNISGSFALGLVTGLAVASDLSWILGVGLLGGYTTFSTVAVETWLLGEERRWSALWANGLGTAAACAAAAAAGVLLGAGLSG